MASIMEIALGKMKMMLRLLKPGNNPEHILNRAGHTRHGVGFEFGEVNENVTVEHGVDYLETVAAARFKYA